jgi:hypothetical protein
MDAPGPLVEGQVLIDSGCAVGWVRSSVSVRAQRVVVVRRPGVAAVVVV